MLSVDLDTVLSLFTLLLDYLYFSHKKEHTHSTVYVKHGAQRWSSGCFNSEHECFCFRFHFMFFCSKEIFYKFIRILFRYSPSSAILFLFTRRNLELFSSSLRVFVLVVWIFLLNTVQSLSVCVSFLYFVFLDVRIRFSLLE